MYELKQFFFEKKLNTLMYSLKIGGQSNQTGIIVLKNDIIHL